MVAMACCAANPTQVKSLNILLRLCLAGRVDLLGKGARPTREACCCGFKVAGPCSIEPSKHDIHLAEGSSKVSGRFMPEN